MSYQSSLSSPKPYFIGIDSDGTVFNSMEIKHKRVFQPIAIETWSLQSVRHEFCAISESINLYSNHRGVNRFQGLAMAFEQLAKRATKGDECVEGHDALQEFVRSDGSLSYAGLAEYNSVKENVFLKQVLEWSQRSDERYAEIMDSEGNLPYSHVQEALERLSDQADIVVVSSSSRETLEKDWGNAGLLPLITRVEGQEQGSKSIQLNSALKDNRSPSNALMIGDALGDLEAARSHGILFYPITPGEEVLSWVRFKAEAIDRFLEGSYAGDYEQKLVADFENVLLPTTKVAAEKVPTY